MAHDLSDERAGEIMAGFDDLLQGVPAADVITVLATYTATQCARMVDEGMCVREFHRLLDESMRCRSMQAFRSAPRGQRTGARVIKLPGLPKPS